MYLGCVCAGGKNEVAEVTISGLPEGATCMTQVTTPGGDTASITIAKSTSSGLPAGTTTCTLDNVPVDNDNASIKITTTSSSKPGGYTATINAHSPNCPGGYFLFGPPKKTSCYGTFTISGRPQPRIFFQGNDITNPKTPVIVALGQQIALTTTPIVAGQTQSWSGDLEKTVGGYTASGNFAVTGATGKGKTKSTDFTENKTTFYWTTTGTKNVTYTVQANGKTSTAQTTFDVQGPTCDENCVTAPQSPMQIFQAGKVWVMGLGNIITAKYAGIIFTETAAASLLPGKFLWVQTYSDSDEEHFATGGGVKNCSTTPFGVALDTYFPYPTPDKNDDTTTNDSPDTLLQSAWSKYSETDNFKMFLMWQSSTADSIPVPLGYVAWSWSGTAVQNPKVKVAPWSLKKSSMSATFHAGNDFPHWSYVAGTGAPTICAK